MQYGELISRSLSLVWRHKYLWLLAILGGADVASGGFGGNFGSAGNGLNGLNGGSGSTAGGPTGPNEAAQAIGQFLQDNIGLIVIGAVLLVIVAIAWFLLSCVTTGALVRASAEHDADRPFGLGPAWRAGVGTFWTILGLRLIGLLLGVVVVALVATMVGLGVVLAANDQTAALAVVIAVGIVLAFAAIVAAILIGLVFILAVRAAVLEQRGAVAALGRGFQLLRMRLGRVLLVWIIQIALAIGAGLAIAVVLIPVILIAAGIVFVAAASGGPGVAVLVGIPFGLLVIAVAIVGGGLGGSYLSTYWTLAFRRLELEAPRPVAWPPAAYQPPPPAAG
jgi:hypothetical protein